MITGGGTGGHVFPALAIADSLKTRGLTPLYAGSPAGMEAKLAPKHNLPFYPIQSGRIKNQSLFQKLMSLLQLAYGTFCALFLLLKKRPVAIIGVGGFVSVPVGLAGVVLGIPLYLQEQNVSVGMANRLLGRFAKKIFLGFEKANQYLPKEKCLTTGNPLRKEFYTEISPLKCEPLHLLIVGGSQGAHAINRGILSLLAKLKKSFPQLSIQHQTGQKDYGPVRSAYEKDFIDHYEVIPFIEDVKQAFEKASLVIARAGALTVSELIATSRPVIFVPYPRTGQNDQVDNARLIESQGAAAVVPQGENFEDRLWRALELALDPATLKKMHESYSGLRVGNALDTIGDRIADEIEK